MLHSLIVIWFQFVQEWGYLGIFILMALESTIVPIPSEIIMPPAAFWAAQGQMNFWGVVAAGTFGSYLGSAISYWVLRWIGPALLYRFGKYILLPQKKIKFAESWVQKHGAPGIFLARLLPVIRHLISMPAGLFKMNFKTFSLVTISGAGLWCYILSYWGQKVIGKHPELIQSPEAMSKVIRDEMLSFVIAIVGITILYLFVVWSKQKSIKNQ